MSCVATDPPWLVIGYGNPLRRDDGVAWAVLEALAPLVDLREVKLLAVQQLAPELAEPLSAARDAAFVDAAVDLPIGQIRCRSIGTSMARQRSMVHSADPAALLLLAEEVYGACPRCRLITIGGGDFGIGQGLSPAVQTAVVKVADLLRTMFWRPSVT